jgi:hypothetical protein
MKAIRDEAAEDRPVDREHRASGGPLDGHGQRRRRRTRCGWRRLYASAKQIPEHDEPARRDVGRFDDLDARSHLLRLRRDHEDSHEKRSAILWLDPRAHHPRSVAARRALDQIDVPRRSRCRWISEREPHAQILNAITERRVELLGLVTCAFGWRDRPQKDDRGLFVRVLFLVGSGRRGQQEKQRDRPSSKHQNISVPLNHRLTIVVSSTMKRRPGLSMTAR